LALVVLSVVEQRLDAVRAVLDGAEVTEVAARLGVHRSVLVSDTTLAVEFSGGGNQVVNRTTTQPVRSIKCQRPRAATSAPRATP
jgi:transposase-like protein